MVVFVVANIAAALLHTMYFTTRVRKVCLLFKVFTASVGYASSKYKEKHW